jgi:hypothetical protein
LLQEKGAFGVNVVRFTFFRLLVKQFVHCITWGNFAEKKELTSLFFSGNHAVNVLHKKCVSKINRAAPARHYFYSKQILIAQTNHGD